MVCYWVLLGFYWVRVGWTRTDQIRSDSTGKRRPQTRFPSTAVTFQWWRLRVKFRRSRPARAVKLFLIFCDFHFGFCPDFGYREAGDCEASRWRRCDDVRTGFANGGPERERIIERILRRDPITDLNSGEVIRADEKWWRRKGERGWGKTRERAPWQVHHQTSAPSRWIQRLNRSIQWPIPLSIPSINAAVLNQLKCSVNNVRKCEEKMERRVCFEATDYLAQ